MLIKMQFLLFYFDVTLLKLSYTVLIPLYYNFFQFHETLLTVSSTFSLIIKI